MNPFNRYNSKIKRVNIPIPSFEFVHRSWISNRRIGDTPAFLIGRDRIIEKLKAWLTKEKTDGGSYLITGYRGMGKTCFVDRVMYELVGEANWVVNGIGIVLFVVLAFCTYKLFPYCISQFHNFAILSHLYVCKEGCKLCSDISDNPGAIWVWGFLGSLLSLWIVCKYYLLKEIYKKNVFRLKVARRYIKRSKKFYCLYAILKNVWNTYAHLSPMEWDRINHFVYGCNVREKRYAHICVNVNLGQEILDERSILCVLTSQLYDKYRTYILSPIANVEMWLVYMLTIVCLYYFNPVESCTQTDFYHFLLLFNNEWYHLLIWCVVIGAILYKQLRILTMLKVLSKRIDAEMRESDNITVKYQNTSTGTTTEYKYPIANTRDIESQLIAILGKIDRFPFHPTFYFVFDELDKIESPSSKSDRTAEYTNEKFHPGGGASKKRLATVLHLLANMKYFTSSAKAKFLFIGGREMFDGYLADMTNREAVISSLFNGVIYVDSFCKNEKSEKDVMYNTEMFISRQLLPRMYIEDRVIDKFIECKLNRETYQNIDINLKMYYEYLITIYSDAYLRNKMRENVLERLYHLVSGTKYVTNAEEERLQAFNESRECIDKIIGLLYHFTVYLYHVSNGSPKKMRLTMESYARPLKDKTAFKLTAKTRKKDPLTEPDIDICSSVRSQQVLSFGEKEQRIIGFIHYISFPVNQIMTDADHLGDKLLVSATFLINHIYKYHHSGFSWRNIEQTPELLEVYKVPEFRGFISSILNYLTQTHLIPVTCGLYQYKFRKQIAEEISLASKTSEEVAAIFNFFRDESQMVKEHYLNIRNSHVRNLTEEEINSPVSVAGQHHILGDLYMADEDYNNAIIEFHAAIRVLKEACDYKESLSPSIIFVYLRNYLKLGLAYEKRRTYVPAYNMHNEAIEMLHKFYHYDISTKFLNELEKEHHREFVQNNQMIYQAILAKLFVNEKIELGGISQKEIYNAENDLGIFDNRGAEYKQDSDRTTVTDNKSLDEAKFIQIVDFYRRIGDILYYKNGLIGFDNDIKTHYQCASVCMDYDCNKWVKKQWTSNKTVPCYASKYYHKALELLLSNLFNEIPIEHGKGKKRTKQSSCDPISVLKNIIAGGSAKSMCQNHMLQMAEVLDCLGNVMLSCARTEENGIKTLIDTEFLCFFLYDVHEMNKNIDNDKNEGMFKLVKYNKEKLSKFETSILYFWEAHVTFKYAQDYKKAADCLKKILRAIQNYLRIVDDEIEYNKIIKYSKNELTKEKDKGEKIRELERSKILIGEFLNEIKNRIVKQCLILLYSHYSFINLVEVQRLKWIFTVQMYENISLSRLTLFPDLEEVMLIYYELIELCIVSDPVNKGCVDYFKSIQDDISKNNKVLQKRENEVEVNKKSSFCWSSLSERNQDFEQRLIGIYNSMSMNQLRHENTQYERILSLKFKSVLNKYIINEAFPDLMQRHDSIEQQTTYYTKQLLGILKCDSNKSENIRWKCFFKKIYKKADDCKKESLSDKLWLLEYLIKDSIYDLTDIIENITPYTSTTLFTSSFIASVYKDLNQWTILFDSLYKYLRLFDDEKKLSEINDSDCIERENKFFKIYDQKIKGNCPNQPNYCKSYIESVDADPKKKNVMWQSRCPYYDVTNCQIKKNKLQIAKDNLDANNGYEKLDIVSLGEKYRKIYKCQNVSSRIFASVLEQIKKPNMHFLNSSYTCEMALKTYRKAREIHREGRAYKDMISRMYYLNDDLKNDTVQFDLAIERFRINSENIDHSIEMMLDCTTNSVYDIENFCTDNQTTDTLNRRFSDKYWNVDEESEM